ncbi:MAG: response regulator [Bacteroidetes bacterium]|nr:response regulator [Bacteroidota bacterium]
MTKPLNILLADDDIDDCRFFKQALEALPNTSTFAEVHDGDELLNYLQKNEEQLPDVLFLDINMPRKNGFECLVEIKKNEKTKVLPVECFLPVTRKIKYTPSLKTGLMYMCASQVVLRN